MLITSSTLTSRSTQWTTCIAPAALRAPAPQVRDRENSVEPQGGCLLALRWPCHRPRRRHRWEAGCCWEVGWWLGGAVRWAVAGACSKFSLIIQCPLAALIAGKITSLVSKGDRVLAERIEDALQRGLPLDSLSANRAVLPAHMR